MDGNADVAFELAHGTFKGDMEWFKKFSETTFELNGIKGCLIQDIPFLIERRVCCALPPTYLLSCLLCNRVPYYDPRLTAFGGFWGCIFK